MTYFKERDLTLVNESNADRIRNMSDVELHQFLFSKLKCWNQFKCKGCEFYRKTSSNGEFYCYYSESELMKYLKEKGGD